MSDPNTLFAALFEPLFEPRRIALIGASADETKTTSRPQRFLRKHGFRGEILPVNPSRSEILGAKAYKDVDAIAGNIDHARSADAANSCRPIDSASRLPSTLAAGVAGRAQP